MLEDTQALKELLPPRVYLGLTHFRALESIIDTGYRWGLINLEERRALKTYWSYNSTQVRKIFE